MKISNGIYLIKADQFWPIGNAGAVIIAKSKKDASFIASTLGLNNPSEPKLIGRSKLSERTIFSNTTNY